MDKERKAFELTDEDMAQVSGGELRSCPNDYTWCTQACLNANCNYLVQNGIVCTCGNGVLGAVHKVDIGGSGSGDNIGKLAKQ